MSNWQKVKIGDFLKRIKRPIKLEKDKNYKLVTIKMHHNGIVLREEKQGSLIKSNMYEVHKGDFILSGIDARNGAFGIIPEALDKAIVTNDFWYFELDENIVNKYFFLELTATSWFDDICKKGSDGTTQRIRLQKDKFFNQEIVLPPLEEQIIFIKKFKQIKSTKEDLESETSTQQSLLKQLKQTILQEAIEGNLTAKWRAKNPAIGTAKELLGQIKTEKEKLVKDKKIKPSKPLAPINEDEIPFDIPSAWEWCKIGDIVRVKIGSTPDRQNLQYWNGNINWVASGEVANNYIYETKEKITELGFNNTSLEVCPSGTVLVAMIGQGKTRGQTSILKIPAATNQNVAALIISHNFLISEYLWFYFLSMYDKTRSNATGGNQPALNSIKINNMTIPFPPLEEQKEIVATIEKLFAICDELEGEINQNKTTVDNLMATVLKEAFGDENV